MLLLQYTASFIKILNFRPLRNKLLEWKSWVNDAKKGFKRKDIEKNEKKNLVESSPKRKKRKLLLINDD